MSYPRNAASPPRIAVGAVILIADGAVQTSGVSVVVRPEGGAESAGGGTIAYSAASGVVYYTPTQAETNYTAFCVIAYKTACIPAQVTVVPTASDTAGVAVLDPAVRVKLDASQPDYAPATAAALATNYALLQLTDTDVAAIEARLPSDPADQSAVEAAITAATSPLATSSALTTVAGNITTILGKYTGITLLARWLGALAGKTADTTTRAEINATTAGAGYNETTDSQEAIRDRGDAAWTTGSGGGGGGPSYSAAVVAARLPVGAAIGWPQEIMCGSAYLTALGTHVPLYVKDVDENILAEMGEKTFTDGDFKAILRLSPLTDENKALSRPTATIEVDSDDTPGIVFNDDTAGEEYFELQMPKAKTVLGEIRTRYLCQVILRWGDGTEFEWIVNLGESKFIRGVAAAP